MSIENEIVKKLINEKARTREDLERVKKEVAKKYKASFPTNMSLLKAYHKSSKKDKKVAFLLKTRPVRSLSGVVNISVLTKPFPCPGKCIYCPEEKNAPKSYLTNEPAVMRAVLNDYDPFGQVKMRIASLEETGHPTEKIELRIVGGTWSFYDKKYREWFIRRCFDACNGKTSRSIKKAHEINESAKHRIVCLSIETRPDFITKEEIRDLRRYGVTMVELGIQSLFDDVLLFTKRGHGVEQTKEATKLLKDAGFKICYQIMLNLPGSSIEKDKETFKRTFSDSSFCPDFLKMYPCLVLENTPLYKLLKKKEHRIFTDKELTDLIIDIKKNIIPRYVRIQRLFRDIPVQSIARGCKISNLRENIKEDEKKSNWRCKCIRCREVKENYDPKEKIFFFREDYDASGGKEVFLSFENKERDKLYALLRLRIKEDEAIIREIRTYGQHIEVKEKSKTSPQHRGLGKKLVKEAEKISKKEFSKNKLRVISGVGVRGYWRKMDYNLEKTYMVKDL